VASFLGWREQFVDGEWQDQLDSPQVRSTSSCRIHTLDEHHSIGAFVEAGLATVTASTENLALSPQGSVVGTIWLGDSTSGSAFPEQGWSDFSVALLAAWIPALQRLARRGETAECYFMDGPYHFSVTVSDASRWRIACFEDREAGARVGHAVLELDTTATCFLGSAITAAKALLGYCDTRAWWNDDTERLRQAVESGIPEGTR
jgi:hypothetical protein